MRRGLYVCVCVLCLWVRTCVWFFTLYSMASSRALVNRLAVNQRVDFPSLSGSKKCACMSPMRCCLAKINFSSRGTDEEPPLSGAILPRCIRRHHFVVFSRGGRAQPAGRVRRSLDLPRVTGVVKQRDKLVSRSATNATAAKRQRHVVQTTENPPRPPHALANAHAAASWLISSPFLHYCGFRRIVTPPFPMSFADQRCA